jgi:hypothetical protein
VSKTLLSVHPCAKVRAIPDGLHIKAFRLFDQAKAQSLGKDFQLLVLARVQDTLLFMRVLLSV